LLLQLIDAGLFVILDEDTFGTLARAENAGILAIALLSVRPHQCGTLFPSVRQISAILYKRTLDFLFWQAVQARLMSFRFGLAGISRVSAIPDGVIALAELAPEVPERENAPGAGAIGARPSRLGVCCCCDCCCCAA